MKSLELFIDGYWHPVDADMISQRFGSAAVRVGPNKIVLCGGSDGNEGTDDTFVLDFDGQTQLDLGNWRQARICYVQSRNSVGNESAFFQVGPLSEAKINMAIGAVTSADDVTYAYVVGGFFSAQMKRKV